jgi:hypothetical protein
MAIQINGDLTGPESDNLRAVLDGTADFFSDPRLRQRPVPHALGRP